MASSCLYFLNRLYIRCLEHHLLAGKHSNVPNTRHTLVFKLTDLSLVKKDSNYNFYRLDLGRYDAVECLVVYSLAPVQLVRVADACELDKNR